MLYNPNFLYEFNLNSDQQKLSELKTKQKKFLSMPKIREETQKTLDEKIKIEFIHSTCKIEGNTYTLSETEALIKFGTTASGKSLMEAQELKNQEEAIKYIFLAKDKNLKINEKIIKEIHALVGKEVVNIPGNYRNHPVAITGTDYQPPKTLQEISQQVGNFIYYLNTHNFQNKNPIEQSIIVNFAISYTQPFSDGNKRTARLLQNLFLVKNNYPFITFEMKDVATYRDAIIKAYETLNLDNLGQITLDQIDKMFELYFSLTQ